MKLDVKPWNVAKIFSGSDSNKNVYKIPMYQREYTWTKKEWEQLFSDVTENDDGYFLGTVIAVCEQDFPSTADPIEFDIIDGQQRFTTISLLLLALYKRISECAVPGGAIPMDPNNQDFLDWLNLKSEITYKTSQRLTLQAQNLNDQDYRRLLKENNLSTELFAEDKKFKNRNIYKAYSYFLKQIDKYCEEKCKTNGSTLLNEYFKLRNKFN